MLARLLFLAFLASSLVFASAPLTQGPAEAVKVKRPKRKGAKSRKTGGTKTGTKTVKKTGDSKTGNTRLDNAKKGGK